jgi:hypothetical protein
MVAMQHKGSVSFASPVTLMLFDGGSSAGNSAAEQSHLHELLHTLSAGDGKCAFGTQP